MNNSFAKERRVSERYPATAPIILNAESFMSSGFLVNISKEGVGLKCDNCFSEQLCVGTQVELIIKDQDKGYHRKASILDAVVCWADEETRKAGLSFVNGSQIKIKSGFADFMPKNKNEESLVDPEEKFSDPDNNLAEVSENLFSLYSEIASVIENGDDLSAHFDSEDLRLFQPKIAKSSLKGGSQKKSTENLLTLSGQISENFQLVAEEFLRTKEIAKEKSSKVDELENAILSFRLIMEAIFHDINNINSVILGTSELLICDLEEGDSNNKENLSDIFNAGIRLAEIGRIAQKLCTNRFAIEPTKVEINSLFSELQLARRDADLDNQVNFELLPESNIEDFVAHKESLMNVLFQVVQNARRHSPENGTIRISFKELQQDTQRLIEITIEDEGGGIPEENLKRIFEPKFTTKKGGGGGLGLTIAQNIIKSIGGDIQVENIVNDNGVRGAKFAVYFLDKNTKSEHLN